MHRQYINERTTELLAEMVVLGETKMSSSIHLCPCCHKYDFSDVGRYEICPVCNWEDDPVQEEEPHYGGGANAMSLNEARKAYAEGRKVK